MSSYSFLVTVSGSTVADSEEVNRCCPANDDEDSDGLNAFASGVQISAMMVGLKYGIMYQVFLAMQCCFYEI